MKIPCFTAFLEDTAFPKRVLGPVDLRAFLRFAACLLLVMISPPVLKHSTAASVFKRKQVMPYLQALGSSMYLAKRSVADSWNAKDKITKRTQLSF